MHAHFGDPLVIDGSYFHRLPAGKKGVAVEEGYRIFDFDNPTDVADIAGAKLGEVRVVSTMHTSIGSLSNQEIRLIKSAGLKSKEEAVRILETRYSKKVRWITLVRFLKLVELHNRGLTQKKEEKSG